MQNPLMSESTIYKEVAGVMLTTGVMMHADRALLHEMQARA